MLDFCPTFIEEVLSFGAVLEQVTVKYFKLSSVAVICQVGKSWQNMSWCNGGSRSNPLSWNL